MWVARLWNVSEERVINAQVNFTTTPFKNDEKWVARLWNVSEERVINAQVNFTTTPFNAHSSRFQDVPPRKLRLQKGLTT